MFFIHVMGRRSKSIAASDLDELGKKVTKEMANKANDAISVAIGKTDQAVMPYVWIRRHPETDEWEGELGDSIKLGIEDGLMIEHDPIQMMGLNDAIKAGFATVEDDGPVRVVSINTEPTPPKRGKLKLTNEEKVVEAKRMVNELFAELHGEDNADDEET